METKKANVPPDASAAALFARLSPEGQRAVLDTMRRMLAQRKAAPADLPPGA